MADKKNEWVKNVKWESYDDIVRKNQAKKATAKTRNKPANKKPAKKK